MNRADLQWLAEERMADAKVLLAVKRWTAAYYLSGYAVECALKACIAKLMKSEEFPDKSFADKCWTHNLPQLVALAGLKADFDEALEADRVFNENWETVCEWTEASRYARFTKSDAEELFAAITHKKNGVLTWVRPRW